VSTVRLTVSFEDLAQLFVAGVWVGSPDLRGRWSVGTEDVADGVREVTVQLRDQAPALREFLGACSLLLEAP
jgi:hypothetical protein